MAPLLLFTALLATTSNLVKAQEQQVTWAAFTFTYHGEKTPTIEGGPYNLTPLGAQQVFEAGEIIRNRYIDAPKNGSQLTTGVPIQGLSVNGINNQQLVALSTDDEYVSASGLAFLQGLYPPRGVTIDEESILGNGTLEQNPLNGYQYPNLGTLSSLDFNYIWLAGNIGCNNYDINQALAVSDVSYVQENVATQSFYASLAETLFWDFDPTLLNYANAWELYEYTLYQYMHNNTIYSNSAVPDALVQLYNLASKQQWDYNTGSNASSINNIAGRTLSSMVLQQFEHTIASNGVSDKMTLMFGSFEPFLAFFELAALSTGPAAGRFNSLPLHGSTMAFELFSNSNSSSSNPSFPPTDELMVRFLYRNGTGETDALVSYPLFGRGNSEVDMSWHDFVQGLAEFALDDPEDWCSECAADTLFCEAIAPSSTDSSSGSSGDNGGNNGLSPALGGVIGALVTLGVLLLVALGLALAGFRISYHPKEKQELGVEEGGNGAVAGVGGLNVLKRSSGGAAGGGGGFKGREKLESDLDLPSGKGADMGVRHERVGSWELGGVRKEGGGVDRVVSMADYGRESEDGIGNVNPFGEGVKGVEHV